MSFPSVTIVTLLGMFASVPFEVKPLVPAPSDPIQWPAWREPTPAPGSASSEAVHFIKPKAPAGTPMAGPSPQISSPSFC